MDMDGVVLQINSLKKDHQLNYGICDWYPLQKNFHLIFIYGDIINILDPEKKDTVVVFMVGV